METRISTATIRRLAEEGRLQYVREAYARPITLAPRQIAADDVQWDLIDIPGHKGPGACIDSQTGDMWRVCVHMGENPRQIMRPGIVCVTITGHALRPYLPCLIMQPS